MVIVESVDDLKFSRSIKGTHGPDFELFDARIAPEYPLQEKGQSGGNECSLRRSLSPSKTDRLLDLRILPGHWGQ